MASLRRVNALKGAPAWAGIPLGGLLGAVMVAAGLTPMLSIVGTAYAVTTSLAGLRPEWHEMDRP